MSNNKLCVKSKEGNKLSSGKIIVHNSLHHKVINAVIFSQREANWLKETVDKMYKR